jgi:polyhydroxybutyrate depolymerase
MLVAPEGTRDSVGRQFWNASDACCDFDRRAPDDVAYLFDLIRDAVEVHGADAGNVYIFGFSNGGFMAHRMACERPQQLRVAVSLAGAGPASVSACSLGPGPVLLEIHGSSDQVVRYAGGTVFDSDLGGRHPGTLATVSAWAGHWNCSAQGESRLDLLSTRDGAETSVLTRGGCKGGPISAWTVAGMQHSPPEPRKLFDEVVNFVERAVTPTSPR